MEGRNGSLRLSPQGMNEYDEALTGASHGQKLIPHYRQEQGDVLPTVTRSRSDGSAVSSMSSMLSQRRNVVDHMFQDDEQNLADSTSADRPRALSASLRGDRNGDMGRRSVGRSQSDETDIRRMNCLPQRRSGAERVSQDERPVESVRTQQMAGRLHALSVTLHKDTDFAEAATTIDIGRPPVTRSSSTRSLPSSSQRHTVVDHVLRDDEEKARVKAERMSEGASAVYITRPVRSSSMGSARSITGTSQRRTVIDQVLQDDQEKERLKAERLADRAATVNVGPPIVRSSSVRSLPSSSLRHSVVDQVLHDDEEKERLKAERMAERVSTVTPSHTRLSSATSVRSVPCISQRRSIVNRVLQDDQQKENLKMQRMAGRLQALSQSVHRDKSTDGSISTLMRSESDEAAIRNLSYASQRSSAVNHVIGDAEERERRKIAEMEGRTDGLSLSLHRDKGYEEALMNGQRGVVRSRSSSSASLRRSVVDHVLQDDDRAEKLAAAGYTVPRRASHQPRRQPKGIAVGVAAFIESQNLGEDAASEVASYVGSVAASEMDLSRSSAPPGVIDYDGSNEDYELELAMELSAAEFDRSHHLSASEDELSQAKESISSNSKPKAETLSLERHSTSSSVSPVARLPNGSGHSMPGSDLKGSKHTDDQGSLRPGAQRVRGVDYTGSDDSSYTSFGEEEGEEDFVAATTQGTVEQNEQAPERAETEEEAVADIEEGLPVNDEADAGAESSTEASALPEGSEHHEVKRVLSLAPVWKYGAIVALGLAALGVVCYFLFLGPSDDSGRDEANLKTLQEILTGVSGPALYEDGSPQQRAFDWLVNGGLGGIDSGAFDLLQERYIMAVLYFSTGGASWSNQYGFLSDSSVCSWNEAGSGAGVSCEANGGEVITDIHLNINSLGGTIPTELAFLTGLTTLSMARNQLSGTLPSQLKNLPKLKALSLRFNFLTGVVPPEIGEFLQLEEIDLGRNSLSGSLPSEMGNLPKLQSASFDNNLGLTGTVPDSYRALTTLDLFYIQQTFITGNIDPIFCGRPDDEIVADVRADCLNEAFHEKRVICSCCRCFGSE